ncbi:MAG: plasma-membrane proton-efflux P-type ATPase [Acidobacteriota bacterium]
MSDLSNLVADAEDEKGHSRPETQATSLEGIFQTLESGPSGLSQEEATRRLARYGFNELKEEATSPLRQLLTYFWGPIAWMIEIAAILSAVIQHWADFGIVLTLLFANAAVGFWEEYQAGNTVRALKAKLALVARVRRDGAWKSIPARELVPGDVIRLRLGDIIPADAALLEGDPVSVDQSALTGESLPVTHQTGEDVFSGSILRQGEIDAVVRGTGANTFFGRTAHLVESAHTVSHFQRAILKIGDYLILIALALVAIILVTAISRGDPVMMTLQFALVLTVAAIPVAMPTVLSVTMAVGARLLAHRQAVVTRLASIEELAGIDTLCSDKTGTLTQNKLTLGDPFCVENVKPAEVIQAAAMASRAEDQDPIDLAVLQGFHGDPSSFQVEHFQPFDPVGKRTEATVRAADESYKVSKGAPQVILALSANAKAVGKATEQAINEFASRGFRSLGVARTREGDRWEFLGILPLFDPPREDSREVIAEAEEMGISVKVVTGDQVAIAREVAQQLDLGSDILDAHLFDETGHDDSGKLAETIEKADGFAQVFPEHKFRIVELLQKLGHIVGMTGDGVNDAPALKKADAGIAVSGATDAARSAADIVLMTPGLSIIIDAIKESRRIFQRMNSYAIYRITETIRVLIFMTASILVFNFYPVTAVMIVLLALLNDGPILAIAYDRVRYSRKPEKWNMPELLGLSTVLGLAGVLASFGLFYLAERVFHLPGGMIQSFMFLKLAVAGHLTIFITRTRGPFWSLKPAPILLWAAVGTKLLATLAAVYGILMPAIGWHWALVVWGYALAWFLVTDRVKLATYRILDLTLPAFVGRIRAHA